MACSSVDHVTSFWSREKARVERGVRATVNLLAQNQRAVVFNHWRSNNKRHMLSFASRIHYHCREILP